MNEIVIRFLIRGLVVSVFAVIGDLFKPRSFAGLFGAAPSVALATLGLTVAADGSAYAALEGRSMLAGAIALIVYSSGVGWLIMRCKAGATVITLCTIPIWLGVSFALCYMCFR